jgi:hypothetical protein
MGRLGTRSTEAPAVQEPIEIEMKETVEVEEEEPFQQVTHKTGRPRRLPKSFEKQRRKDRSRSLGSMEWMQTHDWRRPGPCPAGYDPGTSFKCPECSTKVSGWSNFGSHKKKCLKAPTEKTNAATTKQKPSKSSLTKQSRRSPSSRSQHHQQCPLELMRVHKNLRIPPPYREWAHFQVGLWPNNGRTQEFTETAVQECTRKNCRQDEPTPRSNGH